MAIPANNEEYFAILYGLIENWCDHRCLNALSHTLGAYRAFSGLTDSWSDLHQALCHVRAFAQDELTPNELEQVHDLIAAASRILNRAAI
jgi:hypothetical protein